MIHEIFTVHDVQAGAYLPTFMLPTRAMAKRVFSDCVGDPKHAFCKHPGDYTLFAIGTFNDQTAEIVYTGHHQSLGNGVDFINQGELELDQGNLELVNEGTPI